MSSAWSRLINFSQGLISGILPLANGGTNKNITAVAGGVVWTDANSMGVTAAGSASQVLISNGTTAPTFTLIADANVSASAAIAGSKIQAASTSNAGSVSYETRGTITLTFTVNTTGSPTLASCKYTRVGDHVSWIFPHSNLAVSGTPTSVATAASALPTSVTPASDVSVPIPVAVAGTTQTVMGLIKFGSDGSVTIFKDSIQSTISTNIALGGVTGGGLPTATYPVN